MIAKVIVVEPKYQINIGYIARVAMNFGVKRLFFVKPRAKLDGRQSVMYAKHAVSLLEGAVIYKTLREATKDCDVVIGTTGIWQKAGVNFGNVYSFEDALGRVGRLGKDTRVAILVGRDDIGLRSDEIETCDIVAHIETNPDYPVLNISHSLAIFLYLVNRERFRLQVSREYADREEMDNLMLVLEKMIKKKKKIRNRKAVLNTFRRVISLAHPNRQEVHALITALS